MKHLYLNLKRFDVPVEFGGVNRIAPITEWGSCIVANTQEALKEYDPAEAEFVQFFPEAHLMQAVAAKSEGSPIQIGCHSGSIASICTAILQISSSTTALWTASQQSSPHVNGP